MRPHQPIATKEEAKVNGSLVWRLGQLRLEEGKVDGFFCIAGCTSMIT